MLTNGLKPQRKVAQHRDGVLLPTADIAAAALSTSRGAGSMMRTTIIYTPAEGIRLRLNHY